MILTCEKCARDMEVPPAALGRNIQCPNCQYTFLAKLPAATIIDEDGQEGVILTGEPIDEAAASGLADAPPAARPEAPAPPPGERAAQGAPSTSAPPVPVALPVTPGKPRAPEQKVPCRCPLCGKTYRVSRSCLGMSAKCACGKPFVLTTHAPPAGSANPASAAPASATPAPHAPAAAPAEQEVNIPAALRKPLPRRLPVPPPNAARNKIISIGVAVGAMAIIALLMMWFINYDEGSAGTPTRDNFEAIKPGMKMDKVEELLGKANDRIPYFASVEKGFFVDCDLALMWGKREFMDYYKAVARGEKPTTEGLGKGVIVTFSNGKVKDKAQEGL